MPARTKNGNSKTSHRISVLKAVVSLIGVENILSFSADREFVGTEWFQYLVDEGIPFVIRIKSCTLMKRPGSDHTSSAKEICKRVRNGKRKIFKGTYCIWGFDLYLAASKNKDGELMILASNTASKSVFKYYFKRWGIETLFKYLKSQGFNLEDTHIRKPASLESLFFILSLAVAWSLAVSHSVKKQRPMKKAKHGRWRVSFFRRGLTAIRRSIQNIAVSPGEFIMFCHLLISATVLECVLSWGKKRKRVKILSRTRCEGG